MKRLTIIILLGFLSSKNWAQNYYSKRLNFYNLASTSAQFKLINDTFYLSTVLLGSDESLIGKVALDGTIIPTNKHTFGPGTYYHPYTLTYLNNKLYATGGGGYYSTISAPFIKYNYNCDTLLSRLIGDTTYYNLMQQIIPYYKHKDKLLIIGASDSTCGPGHSGEYKLVIRVVDTNGVTSQTKIYLNDCKYRNVAGIDTAENKGYLLGYIGMYNTWDGDSRILKLDSNLNTMWNKRINITAEGRPFIANHKNQYYTVCSSIVDSVWNFSYKWERVSLTRLDLDGNIIWQKYFGVKEYQILTSGLKECANGDFIICGSRRIVNNQLAGWIMRTDSIGNVKWWRNYTPQTLPVQDTIAQNYLYDIMELPNGDIAATGSSGPSQISSLQQTWLLKVDSNGCFGASDCPTNNVTAVEDIKVNKEISVSVYPNPFNTHFNVSYRLVETVKDEIEIRLIEMATGRLISKQTSLNITDVIQFNTENLAAGMYMVNIRADNVSLSNTKLVNFK